MNGATAPNGAWQEARHTDGRLYYYNTATKQTQWTKPEAMMTAAERGTANWKEYTAEGGRKYWYNSETKVTTWEMPEAFKEAAAQSAAPTRTTMPAQTFVSGGSASFAQPTTNRDRDDYNSNNNNNNSSNQYDRGPPERERERERNYGHSESLRNTFVSAASNNDPDYASYEEAESAFMKLMKKAGVQPEWTWDQTMRAIIKDPQYRSLKDPRDRKATFEKYVVEARLQNKEREKERLAKLRDDFNKMLASHMEIKHYTRWRTARPIIEGETIFRSASDDAERRQLFEAYVIGLKKVHAEQESSNRQAAQDDLVSILKSLDLEPYTRWSDAQGIITSNEQFQSDAKFESLSKSDVLVAFENHIKALERSFNDARQLSRTQKTRRERQNRDQFMTLLRELRADGKIKAGTKWMDLHPLVENDPRFQNMLGQSGSTPLDLFWDAIEDEERALRGKRSEVLDVLDDKRFEITTKTTLEEFMPVVQSDARTSNIDADDLTLLFNRLLEKIVRRNEEDKHHAERQHRRAIDALRSRIKHLDPPVRITDSWEDVQPRVEKYDEYHALDNDELRRAAFAKVVRRLKEKEADVEAMDRSSRRSNGHRARAGGRYSRTPEADPYEADRRKAMADRERNYRKATFSPPRRGDARDVDRRDRYDSRAGRLVSGPYERERRERDLDRGYRGFESRADPRDTSAKELDYGEGGRAGSISGSANGGSSRRRRDSEEEDRRDSKRVRRGDRRSKTPVVEAAAIKEEENFKSGSEEGEIEED